ncbi:MAG: hypothetical protein NTU63_01705 [Candidatus Pacearchaeota archaeon]|nr:hypothetical protein [Candidatus Pacearchaeota archaeon]
MDRDLKKAKIELLENIVKNTHHLIVSTALTPVAATYTFFGVYFNSFADNERDGYAADCIHFFLTKDRFVNFWKRGFNNITKVIEEYRENKSIILEHDKSRYT